MNLLTKYLTNDKPDAFIIYDYRNRISFNPLRKYIPQYFLNNIVFISATSFQQNHRILRSKIRNYVSNSIIDCGDTITCIGGESYLFGLFSFTNVYHYSNSESIYDDLEFNNKFYKKDIYNNLINYNLYDNYFCDNNVCIINLSKLYEKMLYELNKKIYKKIIIINCNHNDFWKKIKLLNNYKLFSRKQFICEKLKYFITVNIFII
jgi:hypothetical protein